MNPVNRLKRDHKLLRSKLDVVEAMLRMGPETWYVLREVCVTLTRQLRNHMAREEELVMACRAAMNPKVLAEMAVEHRDEPEHLQAIIRLFLTEPAEHLERIGPALTGVVQGLRRHMAEEEAELFPIFERELGKRAAAPPARPPRAHLDECMTVNRVLHEYPMTQGVFERFLINLPFEGTDCLDEVAWRHGMDSEEFLKQLERVIPSGTRRLARPSEKHVVCGCQ
ncbi:MAG: hemerythrin domain-containing protein [Candidatus Omnitrophica bacterium]|nr:hemerythrin domain-containing protein [Candidatus Omnitrophota bacterium]